MTTSENNRPRIVFIANCVYGDHVAGGDIHFFHMAQAAIAAGYEVHFFGGQALKSHLEKRGIAATQTCTDHGKIGSVTDSLRDQLRLLFDYVKRFFSTLFHRSDIHSGDVVYAVTDYWFDVLPLVFCRAKNKMMIWHMQAPSLGQIIRKSRPDVDSKRLASLYYWASQNFSLWLFRFCRNKCLLFVHPSMREQLLQRGYREGEIKYISFGVDVEKADGSQGRNKIYDAVWIGRLHRQKGIEDLLATLSQLANRIENFRAVLIGSFQAELQPQIERLGLSRCVEFSGFVSEQEKFRLFHASRVFLMTSRFEGSPRVIAEALVCQVPVVAYAVETYWPIFGDFLRYVPCFDLKNFQNEAELQIKAMRAGANYLARMNLEDFSEIHSWSATADVYLGAVEKLNRGESNEL